MSAPTKEDVLLWIDETRLQLHRSPAHIRPNFVAFLDDIESKIRADGATSKALVDQFPAFMAACVAQFAGLSDSGRKAVMGGIAIVK